MKYRKKEFDLALALAGTWVAHPDPLFFALRLEVRVEGDVWYARFTNPDAVNRIKLPYMKRSLRCAPGELELALTRAKRFCDDTTQPFVRGKTFADMVPDYILAGCPCKAPRGPMLVPRAAKAAAECAKMLERLLPLIGDTPLSSELWVDVCAGIADKVGGAENYRKATGWVRALLKWAKRVKKLPVGELPDRGHDTRAKRAGFQDQGEIDRILRYCAARNSDEWRWLALHVRFLRHVGCRPGDAIEVAGIRLRDVAGAVSADGWVDVRITVPKPHTPARTAVADAALLDVMADIRALHASPRDPDALVFPPLPFGRLFKAALTALQAAEPNYPWLTDSAGQDRTLYSLRHFHATERASQGGRWDVDTLSTHLGNTPEVCRYYYIDQNAALKRASMPQAT